MMDYLLGGGQAALGVGLLVLWWLAFTYLRHRWRHKVLSAFDFAVVPCVFLLWLVGGVILVLHGLGTV